MATADEMEAKADGLWVDGLSALSDIHCMDRVNSCNACTVVTAP